MQKQTLVVSGIAVNSGQIRPCVVFQMTFGGPEHSTNDYIIADAVKALMNATGHELTSAVIRSERSIL